MADDTTSEIPPEVCGLISEHLIQIEAFGTCASLSVVSHSVYWETVPHLFHTVDWNIQLKDSVIRREDGSMVTDDVSVESWTKKANDWFRNCSSIQAVKYMKFLRLPLSPEMAVSDIRRIASTLPGLKAVTQSQVAQHRDSTDIITLFSAFSFSYECGDHKQPFPGLDRYLSLCCPDKRPSSVLQPSSVSVHVDLTDFPSDQPEFLLDMLLNLLPMLAAPGWKRDASVPFIPSLVVNGATPAQGRELLSMVAVEIIDCSDQDDSPVKWNIDILCLECDQDEVVEGYNALQRLFVDIQPVVSLLKRNEIGHIIINFAPHTEQGMNFDRPWPSLIIETTGELNNTDVANQPQQLSLAMKTVTGSTTILASYPIEQHHDFDDELFGNDSESD